MASVVTALALQACGGGGDAPDAAEQSRELGAAVAVQAAASTAATVATVNLLGPDGSSAYRIEQLADGVLKITLSVGDGTTTTGDLRAFYFHMRDNNVRGLRVSGDLVSDVEKDVNAVTQVGDRDTKLSRQSGVVASGGFDVGVEIGAKSVVGADDVQSTVIFLQRPGGLTVDDIRFAFDGAPAYFGLVAASVGTPGTRRRGAINSVFEPSVVLPPPAPPARVYEVGAGHLCFSTQLVDCLGDNTFGQSPSFGTSFVVGATQVAAGVRHSCALGFAIDGGVFVIDVACWGAGSAPNTALPKPVLAGTPTQIATGNDTTCVLTTAGAVQCWAATTDANALNAYTVTVLGTVVDLAVGGSRACALSDSGSVSCWNKDSGAVEGGPSATLAFTQIDAFGGVACGATNSGSAACWGIALATVEPSQPPVGLTGVTQVAVGNNFACAVAADSVTCWPTGLTAPAAGVLTIPASVIDVRGIEAGGDTVCANKRASGEVVCWGAINETFFGSLPE